MEHRTARHGEAGSDANVEKDARDASAHTDVVTGIDTDASAQNADEAKAAATDAGSLGALIPWPAEWDAWPDIPTDEALDLFLGWVEARGTRLWAHQEDALLSLAAGDHVILGTPTGSGKSLVALGLCFTAICTNRRAYYTAPIKALVSEKFFDMVRVLGRDNVGMITGDVAVNTDAPVICCTAEILANDALRLGADADIDCVVMDEFHYYGDAQRGWAWQVPLLALPHAQFLLMSATLGDTSAIATSLGARTGRHVETVDAAERPVPLEYEFVETALEATVELELRSGASPIYVVHFAQDAAYKSAQALASYGVSSKEQRERVKEAIAGVRFTTAFGKALRRLLLCGVGIHHAGMLPRYRLLVEKLAQQGLLPVICGTDTLGVGINVPIHTVLLTALAKYDGRRMRRLNAREFHQIAGRAGRSGFDATGRVVCEATEYDIERARALTKAGGDAKKARKAKAKTPPKGFVAWNRQHFEQLVAAAPETLRPHMRVSHSMVLNEVLQGGDARARVDKLIDDSAQEPGEKERLHRRATEIFATLIAAGVVEEGCDEEGTYYQLTYDMPDNLALDQPLSPFLLAAIELLDREDDNYALDLISMVEATLEDPWQILRAQQHQERDRAMAKMKAEGLDYDERIERLQEIEHPKPLVELLEPAFATYCEKVPWAADFTLSCKSIVRDMVESASDFKGYIARLGIARSEGTLLRYLSDAWRVLDKTVPDAAYDERLDEIVEWLGLVVRTTDSSLLDEWAGLSGEEGEGEGAELAAPQAADVVVRDRRAVQLLVRNALFARVVQMARRDAKALAAMDEDMRFGQAAWTAALDEFFEAHDEVLLDGDARSARYLTIDESREKTEHIWHVRQMVHDADGDDDFGIAGDVDLDATQEEGSVVFSSYRVGFAEELGIG